MKSCSSTPCIPILLIITLTSRSESAVHPVKVKLNDCATLPCSESCSGPVRWTMFSKSSSVVAQCDGTSCRSLKEGYEMNPDPYLKGNFSLIITTADFSKRARYTCDCDDTTLCDFHLQIEPLSFPLQVKTGDSLMLKLDISDTVEVIYDGTDPDGPSSGRICTVDGRSPHCNAEYTQRASLSSYLELRGMTPSESGTYSVVDTANAEVIHKYEVTVEGDESEAQGQIRKPSRFRRSASDCQAAAAVPGWVIPVLAVLLAVCFASVGMNVLQWNKNRQVLKNKCKTCSSDTAAEERLAQLLAV